jgi:PII-like signaling protein
MTSKASQQHLAALRLYFPTATKAKATRFWHHLSAPALAQNLLKVARDAKIVQAILHQVGSGYLPGERMSHHHPELTDMRHPQCLELLDTEHRLRDFIHEHAEELRKVHAVLFLCELPLGHAKGIPVHRAARNKDAGDHHEEHEGQTQTPHANGFQLTFFTEQDRRHGHKPMGEWLLTFAKEHGAVGGTLVGGGEGFDHTGRFHSSHFFELADQPLAITVSVDAVSCKRLLDALAEEDINLAYVKVPVEYGRVGKASK